jgi:hypothetical protein
MNAVSRFAPPAARILLGLFFFVFGLNGFLQFLPQPPGASDPRSLHGRPRSDGVHVPPNQGLEVVAGLLLLRGGRALPRRLASSSSRSSLN